jgi:hypothetical protein
MSYTKKQIEEYQETEYRFFEDAPHISASRMKTILDRIHRHETTLQRINENDCNGHPRMKTEMRDGKMYRFEVEDQDWVQRDQKKENSIHKIVQDYAKELGFQVDFNGDPRGGAIRFTLPSGKSNNWDQKTWGIYW